MNAASTKEKKASNQNSVRRLLFVVISIFLETLFWFFLITKLSEYSSLINLGVHIAAVLIVLVLCSRQTTSAMKLPWVALISAFPFFGVTLYLLIGLNLHPKKMLRQYQICDEKLISLLPEDSKAQEALEAVNEDAACISSYLRLNAGAPLFHDSDVEYFHAAADGLEAQLKALAGARHFIFMEYHAIENAESWQRIQNVLEERVKAGVEVRVFYDDMGSIGFLNLSFPKQLEAKGIQCRVFNPFVPGLNVFLNNRDHRKITVVDGEVGFTGGYNLANEYFNVTHPYGMWKDTGIRITGPAVKGLTAMFLEMWNAGDKKQENGDTDFARYMPDIPYTPREPDCFCQPYSDSPLRRIHAGEEVYISMVNAAKHFCWFTTPYLILSDELNHALKLAAKRGVDVRIITPGIPDKKMIYNVTRSFYAALAAEGVRIYEWSPGFIHAKMSLADGKMATCGTINMDYRSLYHHFENGCFFTGGSAVSAMQQDFEHTFDECREVTEEYKSGKSAILTIGQMNLRLFAGLL